MRIKTILIDDEPLATVELNVLLQEFPDIEVAGTANTYAEGLRLISDHDPDLLFLDIDMPEKNGFELLESLDTAPNVVFVTAHDHYALNAYEANALDYLLKPVNPDRLSDALIKVRRMLSPQTENPINSGDQVSIKKKIFVKDGERCFFIALQEIYLIESMGNYARLYYQDKKPLLHKSLSYLEEKLPADHFFRANRQQMINLNYVKNIYPFFNSTLRVELLSGDMIDISQRQSVRFRELTGI